MKKCYALICVVIMATTGGMAQDPHFTQFYANPLYLNPALAGSAKCPRAVLNYRNQWPALSGTYVNYAASFDAHSKPLSGGIGLQVMQDNQAEGTISSTYLSAMYAYAFNPTRTFTMRAGFQATYMRKAIDYSKLNFGDQIDPAYGFIYPTDELMLNQSYAIPDFSAGLFGYGRIMYAGVAMHHLTRPPDNFGYDITSRLPRKFTGHMGARIPLKRQMKDGSISPNILYHHQKDFQELNMGLYVTKGVVVGGMWYRFSPTANSDAFMVLVGLHTDMLKIGYSYDLTVSSLNNSTYGSHEISFGIQFDCIPRRTPFRPLSCPSF